MSDPGRFDVVGLGASTVDILTLVDHLPVEEEVLQACQTAVQGGGPVATAIVTLARLGASVAMLDALGDDWRGSLIGDEFARAGVCTDYLVVRPVSTSSLSCLLVLQGSGARSIVWTPGSAAELSVDDLPRAVIQQARFLHLNGRHGQACLQACRWARQAGVQVSFDGGAGRYRPELRALLPLCDIAIVARSFAERYTGLAHLEQAAQALLGEGPSLVVVTDGLRGSWIQPRQGPGFHQPAYRVPVVVDTTGCGDSYHGAFLFGLLRGMDLQRTAALASATAALNAQHLGGRSGLPGLSEVEAFLEVAEPLRA